MLVLDNIIYSLQSRGGVSVVWTEMLSRMLNSQENYVFLEYTNACNNLHRKQLSIPDDKIIKIEPTFLGIERYLPVRCHVEEGSVFHSSYYRYANSSMYKNITTVHDFTYEYFVSGIKKHIHSTQKRMAISNSERVICVSENTKKDLLKFCPECSPDNVRVVYNGVSPIYRKLDSPLNGLPFPEGSYLIYVGSRAPYKNFGLLIEALPLIKHNIVIVGGKLSNKESNALINYSNRIKVLSNVSDEELNVLYNGAAGLVYPSSYEGFGIPILEAQRAGCPVIALNASSVPEVIGDTPLLMDNATTNELVSSIQKLDSNSRFDIVNMGINNSMLFSWDKTFKEMQKVYSELQ